MVMLTKACLNSFDQGFERFASCFAWSWQPLVFSK